jgi:hypothetical protein
MYIFINALLLAVLLPAGGAEVNDGRSCKAEVKGLKLLTIVHLPGGIVVEGPWEIVHSGEMREQQPHYVMLARLDHVVERDAITGEQKVIPLPAPVNLTFEGTSQHDLVEHAAQIWCVTVMRAREGQALDRPQRSESGITRVVALPRSQPHG